MLDIATNIKPKYVCYVPERREELTTEGGLDVINQIQRVKAACQKMADAKIIVSLFIAPDLKQIEAAASVGAPCIEIHTGCYADAKDTIIRTHELDLIKQSVKHANQLGLQVNAGHGLHYENVQAIAAIPEIIELNIGHSIIARALMTGMHEAVETMKSLMLEAQSKGASKRVPAATVALFT